jgi:intracellular multiplication protein IcmE
LAAGFTPKELENSGVNPADIIATGRNADCSVVYLQKARADGLSAETIKQTLGCSAAALKAAGYTAKELKDAGFTAAELKAAGFSAAELKNAGFSAKELKNAGFSAAELKAAGFSAKDLKDAGFSTADLKNAGFSADQLKAAGFSAAELKNAGFSAAELKAAGYSAKELKDAGYTAAELKNAGYTAAQLEAAGFSPQDSSVAGLGQPSIPVENSTITALPTIPGAVETTNSQAAANNEQLQSILNKQNEQMAEQKYQQKIQQRTTDMITAANQYLQNWKSVGTQSYVEGNEKSAAPDAAAVMAASGTTGENGNADIGSAGAQQIVIKTGDIIFAVMDTAVNSDEPGPILATIVSGRFKGTKLIGSFTLPANANSMVIMFNTMSIPGSSKTISISSFAIDPNTARTALSSRTDHHYLMRYGSLFASSFLEGFGNAFQSANTTVTIGGTGGGNNVTIQNGVGRSSLQNAVIGLATVGKSWGQAAQQLFSTPVTVEVYAGTGIGVLFTQDVSIS